MTVSIDELIAGSAAVLTFVATLPLLRTVWQRTANPWTHPLSRHALLAASTALWLVYGIRNGVLAPAAMCGLAFVLHVLICLQVGPLGHLQGRRQNERLSVGGVLERDAEPSGLGRAEACRCPPCESGACPRARRSDETVSTTNSGSHAGERSASASDGANRVATPGAGRRDA